MDLAVRDVRLGAAHYRAVKKLYFRAFPKYERIPWRWMLFKALFKEASFLAFFDDQKFVGFTYIVHGEGMHYVLFLAVNDQLRSLGYGTRILNAINEMFENDILILDVEKPDVFAENNNQRMRRINFYKRNGFYVTANEMQDKDMTYCVMATDRDISKRDLDPIFNWFSWPLGRFVEG